MNRHVAEWIRTRVIPDRNSFLHGIIFSQDSRATGLGVRSHESLEHFVHSKPSRWVETPAGKRSAIRRLPFALHSKDSAKLPHCVNGTSCAVLEVGPRFSMGAKASMAAEALPTKKGMAVIIGVFCGGPLVENKKSISISGVSSKS